MRSNELARTRCEFYRVFGESTPLDRAAQAGALGKPVVATRD